MEKIKWDSVWNFISDLGESDSLEIINPRNKLYQNNDMTDSELYDFKIKSNKKVC